MEAKGWETILCYNYRDGLKAVRESSEWDVVISDMRLGNDNGIDLLEWMRSNGYQNPFIIMTSYDESMSAVRTMKLGAEDYIPKKLLLDVVYETRVRDNILKSKEQKNIQPPKGGHKMVTCQNYVSLFYCQITSCPSDGGIS